MPDTLAHHPITEADARREAAETARRWFDNAEKCERNGMMRSWCIACADEALERSGIRKAEDEHG